MEVIVSRPVLVGSANQLTKIVRNLVMNAHDIDSIVATLSQPTAYIIAANLSPALPELVTQICNDYAPYKRIQNVLRNELIIPNNRKDWFLFNPETQRYTTIKKENLQMDFVNKNDYLARSHVVSVTYSPNRNTGLYEDNGIEKFNKYMPPFWKTGTYTAEPIPELLQRFLTHLTDADSDSINFILDWIAISLQPGRKNSTYLTAIGNQGVGKGLLAKIIEALHGEDNSSDLLFESIRKQFNKQFADKTFVFLDEVYKASNDEMNRLKKQNDSKMEVELKGIDSEVVENHNNIYIASNNFDALRLEPDDRRHSIINLTSKRLETAFSKIEMTQMYSDMGLIKQFANFLMTRTPAETSYTYAFKSKNAAKILESSAYEWEKFVIDEFCKDFAGHTISCRSAADYIGFKMPKHKTTITTNAIELLSRKFKNVFSVIKTDDYEIFSDSFDSTGLKTESGISKRLNCMAILPLNKQANYEIQTSDD